MIIQSKRVWVAEQFVAVQVEIEDGKIKAINDYGEKAVDFDFGNQRIVPGFIDVHTHGAYGYDTNEPALEGLFKWAATLPKDEGVTSFLPTTVTHSEDVLLKAVENVAKAMKKDYNGAEILGVHMEGPYLNLENKGAQPAEYILKTDLLQFQKYQTAANDQIKYITMAAEADPNHQLIKYCAVNKIAVALGHASASYDEIVRAYGNGAVSMTHVHNGMPLYNHRNPSMAGAAYRLRSLYGEMVGDLNHVNPVIMNNYFTIKGDYTILISDSLLAKGFAKGIYKIGGQEFEIRDNGSAYLLGGDTLAGSTMRMNIGLKNLVEDCDIPFKNALKSCTINPARMLKIDDYKGELRSGFDGDITVIDDNYEIVQCYCKGKKQIQ